MYKLIPIFLDIVVFNPYGDAIDTKAIECWIP